MTITPEMIAAYADGELEGAERDRVEQALAHDPALARQVDAHRALKARLSAHFAPILDAPLPEALTRAVRAQPEAEVLSLDAARKARAASASSGTRSRWAWGAGRRWRPRWRWPSCSTGRARTAAPAMRTATGGGARHAAFRNQAAGAPVRVMLSFADARGDLCRGYSGQAGSGIACRDARGWRLERRSGSRRRRRRLSPGRQRRSAPDGGHAGHGERTGAGCGCGEGRDCAALEALGHHVRDGRVRPRVLWNLYGAA
jgi:hypothetical protein